jgi:hypothetical protein
MYVVTDLTTTPPINLITFQLSVILHPEYHKKLIKTKKECVHKADDFMFVMGITHSLSK